MTTQTHLVTGTDFITVATKDYDTAVEFYGNVLGLHHRYAPPDARPDSAPRT